MKLTDRMKAILQALFVAFLWSTSWVLIKFGLVDVPSITFGGLRYFIAFLFMAVYFLRKEGLKSLRNIPPRTWNRIIMLGIFYYALTQGAQYFGLGLLPAVSVNLLLGLSAVVVALFGMAMLGEKLTWLQWLGVILSPVGAWIYFYPVQFPADQIVGIGVVVIGLFANAIGMTLGRDMNRTAELSPVSLTTLSMGVGAVIMLISGITFQGLPAISLTSWGIIIWLALVNTALAFTIWNHSMRILTAVESSMINNTMMVQVPILAVIFLGETITPRQLIGMIITIAGVVLVQVFRKPGMVVTPEDSVPDSERGSAQGSQHVHSTSGGQ